MEQESKKRNRSAYLQERIKEKYKDVSTEELNKRLKVFLNSDASQKDLKESVRLIMAGADRDSKDNNGSTALMWAADNGHTEIVRLLIDKGADINTENNYGYTALMEAAGAGHTEIVELLSKRDQSASAFSCTVQ